MATIMVSGGAGYIGSHTVLQLLHAGYKVLAVDNFDNSSPVAVSRVKELAGNLAKNFSFVEVPGFDRFIFYFKHKIPIRIVAWSSENDVCGVFVVDFDFTFLFFRFFVPVLSLCDF